MELSKGFCSTIQSRGGGKGEGAEGKIVQEVQYIFQPAKAHVK